MYWKRQWQPTPVLLPGKPHGRRNLVGAVHGFAKSRTRLSDFTFPFHFHALEKEMATHSSVLAWRIPGMGEPMRENAHRRAAVYGVAQNWTRLKQLSNSSSSSSVYISIPISQFTASFPSWYTYICSLCLCLYFCLQISSSVPFFYFPHISNIIYFSLSDLLHSV